MSYGTSTVNVHKKLKLDKRGGSDNWCARLTLDNGKRVVKSTKTDDLNRPLFAGGSKVSMDGAYGKK
jgi:hypothetical protein